MSTSLLEAFPSLNRQEIVVMLADLVSPELLVFVATLFLVAVTYYYAIQTKRTVDEMRKATEAQFIPQLRLGIGLIGPVNLEIEVANVGKGAAVNVTATYSLREFNGSVRTWTAPIIGFGEKQRLGIPIGESEYEYSMSFFKEHQSTLDFKATYFDVLGKTHLTSDVVDITGYVKQFDKTRVGYHEEELTLIRQELEKIWGALEKRKA